MWFQGDVASGSSSRRAEMDLAPMAFFHASRSGVLWRFVSKPISSRVVFGRRYGIMVVIRGEVSRMSDILKGAQDSVYAIGDSVLKAIRPLARRPSHGFRETEHRLLQLRIHFVGDGHHIEQHSAEIHTSQIVLQRIKDGDLQDARLFNNHGDRSEE